MSLKVGLTFNIFFGGGSGIFTFLLLLLYPGGLTFNIFFGSGSVIFLCGFFTFLLLFLYPGGLVKSVILRGLVIFLSIHFNCRGAVASDWDSYTDDPSSIPV